MLLEEHLFIFTLADSDLDFVQIHKGNHVVARCFVSSHFLLRVITEDVFDDFDAGPFSQLLTQLSALLRVHQLVVLQECRE